MRLLSPALVAALLCALALPAAALAAAGEQTPLGLSEAPVRAAQATPAAGGGGLVRTIVGLAVVLGVIYGLHWILKQVKASREERHSGTGLGTLATLPLGPNRSLHLIRAGAELVLVGVGEGGVTPIRTYSEPEARELGLLEDDAPAPAAAPAPSPGSPAARAGSAFKLSRVVDDLRARTVLR